MNILEWLATLYFFCLLMTWVVGPKMVAMLQSSNPTATVTQRDIYLAVLLSVIPIINLAVVYYAIILGILLKLCDSDKERIALLNELLDESLSKEQKKAFKERLKKKKDSGTSSGEDS